MTTVADLTQSLQTLFTTTADQVARRTGFVQRTSKLTGAAFVQALVFGWLANPQASVEGLAQAAAAVGVAISAQGLDQRFTEAAAVFLEHMLTAAVQTVIAADPVAIPLLERFTAVVLLASSTITLPAALALWWPGCSKGTAALKLHVRYDLCRGCLSGLVVQEGRISDRSTVMQTAPLPRGALRISDLGFFTLAVFAAMTAQGVYWLSRLAPGTAVYTQDGARWDVLDLLAAQGTATVDLAVTLGVDHRLPGRLLAVRVTIVVTSVPPTLLSLREALVLLRARWQIELLFKLWKSHGHIDESRSANPWRVLTEVFAKLLAMVVQHWLLLVSCWAFPDRSLLKAAQTIRPHALSLASALVYPAFLDHILAVVQRCVAAGCRLNRRKKKPNTYQLLLEPSLAGLA
ncbi:MAG: IS4 family transposase [Chloroflexi bacterium]|nr:IS4 family transposase [Chloroflexota bacterium]